MYAIYYSDSDTDGRLCLFGVVKYEAVAIEFAKTLSFERRWDRYQLRYCHSPYLEGSIPRFTVCSLKFSRYLTYYGFFKAPEDAERLFDFMSRAYPGIQLFVRNLTDTHELRAPHMDTQSALF